MYIVENGAGQSLADSIGNTGSAFVIEDQRENPRNANIKIYYSYLITDNDIQREILQVIIDYNLLYLSEQEWSRELDEMEDEWDYHNALAAMGIMVPRTGHVDLDMNDKNKSFWEKGWEFFFD